MESEPFENSRPNTPAQKLENVDINISAQCNRVAVIDGHTENCSGEVKKQGLNR